MRTTISLCVICGDAGIDTLGRMLKSVLSRSGGPLVDEVIIGFNGTGTDRFKSTMFHLTGQQRLKFAGAPDDGVLFDNGSGGHTPRIHAFKQTWQSDFSAARNETWAKATGEWVLWLDTDDVVMDASTKEGAAAIAACERDYGIPQLDEGAYGAGPDAPSLTLRDWLASLPTAVNTILCPYDYTVDENGYVVVRQLMKRIVRRSANHIWRNPIHEVLYPTGAAGEVGIQNLGFLVRHFPVEEVQARVRRNADIVAKMDARPELNAYGDARHAYDVANAAMAMGDLRKADAAIRNAISWVQNDVDRYTYRLARAGVNMAAGQHETALSEALAAIGIRPEIQDAYYAAAEVYFVMAKHAACIRMVELGNACRMTPGQRDQPLALWVQPRAQAAMSCLQLGRFEEAVAFAEEAMKRYPKDALAVEAYRKAVSAANRQTAIKGVLDAAEYLIREKNAAVAHALLVVATDPGAIALRGIEALPRFRAMKNEVKAFYSSVPLQQPLSETDDPEELKARAELAKVAEEIRSKVDEFRSDSWPQQVADEEATLRVNPYLFEARATKRGTVLGIPYALKSVRPIFFYCPHAAAPWKPSDVDSVGLGGSEGSVAYLARELVRRGYPVHTFTPGGPTAWKVSRGVVEHALTAWEHDFLGKNAILIACRAPWVMRHPEYLGKTVFAWHQDNGYGNPWMWNSEVANLLTGSLHVSGWAREQLLKEAPEADGFRQHIIGNGVSADAFEWAKNPPKRVPGRVIYASDPTRGLGPLLVAWPEIRKRMPHAELHVYCSFVVMLALKQSEPGMPGYREQLALEQLMRNTPGVTYHGWVPHKQLLRAMAEADVYAYPGGLMPEGFGVSLAQAAVSGLKMVVPYAGALPEVLLHRDSTYFEDPEGLRTDLKLLTETVCTAIEEQRTDNRRISDAGFLYERLRWERVADAFLAAVKEKA